MEAVTYPALIEESYKGKSLPREKLRTTKTSYLFLYVLFFVHNKKSPLMSGKKGVKNYELQ